MKYTILVYSEKKVQNLRNKEKNVFGLVWCKIQALFLFFSVGLDAVYNYQELFCPISFFFSYFCDDDIGMK